MDSFFSVKVQYSTSHLFFPKIVIAILVFLAVSIAAKNVIIRLRAGRPLVNKNWRFFVPGADFFMLGGSLVLFILYVFLMDTLGFLASSLICVFLYNLLFCRTRKVKSVLVSLASTAIACFAVWYLFAIVFNISLP